MNEFLIVIANIYYVYLVITAIYLLLDNREPSVTIAWLIVFAVFPVFGFIAYLFLGRDRRWINRSEKFETQFIEKDLMNVLKPLKDKQDEYIAQFNSLDNPVYSKELVRLLYQSESSLLTTNNAAKIIYSGEEKLKLLQSDLKKAKQSIHIEYFIWRDDVQTQEIKKVLIDKVKEGVEVRALYDCFGSIFLKRSYIEELRAAGVKMYPFFNFLTPLKLHTINYRNHRKIVVIDGKVGYTGGMNLGKEYIDGGRRFPGWRDTHLRLEGEVVRILQATFAIDWINTTEEKLFEEKYFPHVEKDYGYLAMQSAISGPDTQWKSIQQMYFALITSAEKNVFIQSPYFVPDATVTAALKTAALKGVEVKILTTGWPDKYMPYWAAFTYFEDLLESGVKIYHYTEGFMHAKVVTIDGELASVGTANMDMRSFQVNYEQQMVIYKKAVTADIEKKFAEDINASREFTMVEYKQIPNVKKLRNSIARLFAPLL